MRRRRPGTGKGGTRHVGRLRVRAAAILSEHLGWNVQPEDIRPATGAWRTNAQFDVYRWEVFTRTSTGLNVVAGCWYSLTEFVRDASGIGCHVTKDDTIYPGPRTCSTDRGTPAPTKARKGARP